MKVLRILALAFIFAISTITCDEISADIIMHVAYPQVVKLGFKPEDTTLEEDCKNAATAPRWCPELNGKEATFKEYDATLRTVKYIGQEVDFKITTKKQSDDTPESSVKFKCYADKPVDQEVKAGFEIKEGLVECAALADDKIGITCKVDPSEMILTFGGICKTSPVLVFKGTKLVDKTPQMTIQFTQVQITPKTTTTTTTTSSTSASTLGTKSVSDSTTTSTSSVCKFSASFLAIILFI